MMISEIDFRIVLGASLHGVRHVTVGR